MIIQLHFQQKKERKEYYYMDIKLEIQQKILTFIFLKRNIVNLWK